ncbi:hypothetical protein PABG_12220 [Paracoccidioides brasiliensis Pb03]|nr:hypothetical protein PABG_12220 [Paracoccidioides brasiliensis Pb03]
MRFLALLPLLLVALYKLDQALPRFYIFDPKKLQDLSKASIERHPNNVTALMADLNQALRLEYGHKHVLPFDTDPDRWVFSNHGNAMGAMLILHASISEYLIFYGTPLGSEGHSGVHLADDYFTILHGVERRFMPGELEATEYYPGDQNWLKRGMGSQYQLHGWALELAQGWIPSMLPFGFVDTFTSTLDIMNLWKTVYWTAKDAGSNGSMSKPGAQKYSVCTSPLYGLVIYANTEVESRAANGKPRFNEDQAPSRACTLNAGPLRDDVIGV